MAPERRQSGIGGAVCSQDIKVAGVRAAVAACYRAPRRARHTQRPRDAHAPTRSDGRAVLCVFSAENMFIFARPSVIRRIPSCLRPARGVRRAPNICRHYRRALVYAAFSYASAQAPCVQLKEALFLRSRQSAITGAAFFAA